MTESTLRASAKRQAMRKENISKNTEACWEKQGSGATEVRRNTSGTVPVTAFKHLVLDHRIQSSYMQKLPRYNWEFPRLLSTGNTQAFLWSPWELSPDSLLPTPLHISLGSLKRGPPPNPTRFFLSLVLLPFCTRNNDLM